MNKGLISLICLIFGGTTILLVVELSEAKNVIVKQTKEINRLQQQNSYIDHTLGRYFKELDALHAVCDPLLSANNK